MKFTATAPDVKLAEPEVEVYLKQDGEEVNLMVRLKGRPVEEEHCLAFLTKEGSLELTYQEEREINPLGIQVTSHRVHVSRN